MRGGLTHPCGDVGGGGRYCDVDDWPGVFRVDEFGAVVTTDGRIWGSSGRACVVVLRVP